jgi:crotonobetainyl-CoA:carnitine CoA-transferase CaiB-like acyl-CoA transferase
MLLGGGDAMDQTPSPLSGVRVIDLSQVAAGPYAATLLGDFGAEVIKVEPLGGEPFRKTDEAYGPGNSGYFFGINRSKRAMALDLKSAGGQEVLASLVKTADFVLVSMRPKAAKNLGVDYESLSALKPDIIYCSITAFGESGPRAADPGMDILVQAMGGLMGTTGEPGRMPVKVGSPVSDFATSYLVCFALLAALRVRDRSGTGQKVSVSLLDATVGMLANYVTPYLRTGVKIRPVGSGHNQVVPYQAFMASDRWLVVACLHQGFWEKLCGALERPDLLGDERFSSNTQRVKNREALVAELSEVFSTRRAGEWEQLLREHDVPVGQINRLEDVITDPQVVHNGMVTSVEHPGFGAVPVVANPVKMSKTPPVESRYAPYVGEHTVEILHSLGYDDARIERLREDNAISWGG